ncbi:MAG: non-ribosomal peptide synthetase, partial [Clostridia bacterium]|nr:non-ribosomal peptide synthetase [Clostridia bacterium]
WLPDGNIEYLGRIDEQVKIRGFRIELGEIESRIREIENVKDCAVIAKTDSMGEKSLYAYYTCENMVSVSDIKSKLGESLPNYMVPSYMMCLESIPITRNGKLDKKALPEIEAKALNEYVAPKTETQSIVCEVFREILGAEKVGIKDNFFELGGHSLRATRLVNIIEAKTGVKVALKDIFTHSTPEEIAYLVDGRTGEEYEPIPKAEEKEYYPMSSTQKRTYLIQQLSPESMAYNMPYNMKMSGGVYPDKLEQALQKMIDRHEILRTAFMTVNGEPVQKILENVKADFEYISSNEPDEKLAEDFYKPFDLSNPPLVRVRLVNKGEYHLFLMDTHHIVSDGMSRNIFIRELTTLYNGGKLEPLSHQYKDYSEWMRTRDLSGQETYWKNQFNDEIPVLDMPLDYTRPQIQSYAGSTVYTFTDEKVSSGIKAMSERTGATEYMIFLAALMVTLGKYSRQEDIVIGSPISGRTHKDTESMLGMFINTLAMRGYPEGNKTFAQFLSEIKELCLNSYANQEYPFEELVEKVNVQRDMSRNPLFDVMLVMQNNEKVDADVQDVEMSGVNIESASVAKFDMNYNVIP